jgi:hypothetical protein
LILFLIRIYEHISAKDLVQQCDAGSCFLIEGDLWQKGARGRVLGCFKMDPKNQEGTTGTKSVFWPISAHPMGLSTDLRCHGSWPAGGRSLCT